MTIFSSDRLPPEHHSGEWEEIGEDANGGLLYRLQLPHGWLVQVVGENHTSIAFVPAWYSTAAGQTHVDWSQRSKPQAPNRVLDDDDEPPPMFA